jgi:ribulose 1,5-bisphosphate synthetase/thiazole synthase
MTVGKTHQDGQSGLPTSNSSASFWHSQPSEALTGHRTTELLPKFTDVVIVGSGISGAFAARHLAEDEAGKDLGVVMLEAREACWGATGRVCPGFSDALAMLGERGEKVLGVRSFADSS